MADERRRRRARRVTVVFCGGCNPHIDRAGVAAELAADDATYAPGATVHLAAARARARPATTGCVSDRRAPGATSVVVAGELVDGVPTPAASSPPTVTRKLKE